MQLLILVQILSEHHYFQQYFQAWGFNFLWALEEHPSASGKCGRRKYIHLFAGSAFWSSPLLSQLPLLLSLFSQTWNPSPPCKHPPDRFLCSAAQVFLVLASSDTAIAAQELLCAAAATVASPHGAELCTGTRGNNPQAPISALTQRWWQPPPLLISHIWGQTFLEFLHASVHTSHTVCKRMCKVQTACATAWRTWIPKQFQAGKNTLLQFNPLFFTSGIQ